MVMKAAVLSSAAAAPEYADFADPEPEHGREIVRLVAAGIHPITRSMAAGRHYGSAGVWPMIPGVDAVARTDDGELIYTGYPVAPYGTLAERISVPAGFRITLPADADPVPVAAGLNPGMSSWLPLRARAREVGDLGTVLVLGATGMAGLLAMQNAPAFGASRVIAAGRSEAGLARAAEYGAAATARLTGDQEADAAAIAAALEGGSPSLVLDYVWGHPAEATFRALSRRGLDQDEGDTAYVQIGALAGAEAAVPSALLRSRRIRISGSGAGSASVAEVIDQLPVYLRRIADGAVTVPARPFPLSLVAQAWAAAENGGDRVVVVPG
jgi:NADPH:quinone reductase-like Zn-dependent oxidoreductase